MEGIHDTLGPWVGTYPIISLLVALGVGFVLGMLVFKKKKKQD
jgi:ElaB/YqjD/DUF883 family membrane-anchored ribosome-binding protein